VKPLSAPSAVDVYIYIYIYGRRVSKLRIQDVLPFRVAAGQSLVRRGSKHPGKLYPEGPGSTDPYYDEEDKLPDTWEEPECDLPAILKGKVKCTIGNKRKITGTDPNGVERQAEMKGKHEAKWKGHVCEGAGCPEEDSSWQEYDKFRAYLQAADQETEAAPSTSYHITSIAPAPKCNEVCMPFYLSVKELCTHTARKAASLASKMVKLSLSLSLSPSLSLVSCPDLSSGSCLCPHLTSPLSLQYHGYKLARACIHAEARTMCEHVCARLRVCIRYACSSSTASAVSIIDHIPQSCYSSFLSLRWRCQARIINVQGPRLPRKGEAAPSI
jgi:hypothetical protein